MSGTHLFCGRLWGTPTCGAIEDEDKDEEEEEPKEDDEDDQPISVWPQDDQPSAVKDSLSSSIFHLCLACVVCVACCVWLLRGAVACFCCCAARMVMFVRLGGWVKEKQGAILQKIKPNNNRATNQRPFLCCCVLWLVLLSVFALFFVLSISKHTSIPADLAPIADKGPLPFVPPWLRSLVR